MTRKSRSRSGDGGDGTPDHSVASAASIDLGRQSTQPIRAPKRGMGWYLASVTSVDSDDNPPR